MCRGYVSSNRDAAVADAENDFAEVERCLAQWRAHVRTVTQTGASSGRKPNSTRPSGDVAPTTSEPETEGASPTSVWKPRLVGLSNVAAQATLDATAKAARARRQPLYDEEVKASQDRYGGGGSISSPRRDQHRSIDPRSNRHISKAAAGRLGVARGETHDANTEFRPRDFASLQKRAARQGKGGGQHPSYVILDFGARLSDD